MKPFLFNKEKLLSEAIAQNVKMMRSLHKTDKVSEDSFLFYQENLDEASQSLQSLINPVAVIKDIPFEFTNQEVVLNNSVKLNNKSLQKNLNIDSKILLYGMTLSFDTEVLLKASNYDYALSQFQYILSKTMLLNMGKELFDSCKIIYSEKKLTRHAIFQQDSEKNKTEDKNLWSPQQIALLIPELQSQNFQVTANENGCLQPLFSIVGIMTSQNKTEIITHI
jgi:hypothetical protein